MSLAVFGPEPEGYCSQIRLILALFTQNLRLTLVQKPLACLLIRVAASLHSATGATPSQHITPVHSWRRGRQPVGKGA